jgi:hypothetical protein
MRIAGNQTNPNRHPTDLYPTDERWTEALLREVALRGPIWECAAGEGQMVRVLERCGHAVRATDILTGDDFLTMHEPWDGSIVTNPPYSHADTFIHHALAVASNQVAMLLPLGALGGQTRYRELWIPHPPARVIVVVNRMTVLGKPSQFNHMWVVWDKAHVGQTTTSWVRA